MLVFFAMETMFFPWKNSDQSLEGMWYITKGHPPKGYSNNPIEPIPHLPFKRVPIKKKTALKP